MKFPKPNDADHDRSASLVPDAAGVEVKPMFGNLGGFVNGNMFVGLFGAEVGVKLSDENRARLLNEPGAGPFGPAERPMAGYVTLPAGSSARKAKFWTGKALAHVASLPPQQPKKAAAKKATS